MDPISGTIIENDVAAATKQVMENISALLSEANMNFDNVVKCSIFLKDLNDFETVNAIYAEFFRSEPPARETVQVARLPKDVSVEISCIAIR